MKAYLLFIFFLLLAGCNPLKKAVRTMDDYPAAASLYCADRFPVRDSTIVRDSISYDTLWGEGETLRLTEMLPGDTIKTKCPPAKTVIKTIRHDSLIIRRDIARETVLRNNVDDCNDQIQEKITQYNKLNEEYKRVRKNRNWWRIACLLTWGLIGIGLFWKIKSKLSL